MLASLFLDVCQKNGIGFFTGVPDSLLKGFCDELFVRYGTDGNTHVVAHNDVRDIILPPENPVFVICKTAGSETP